MEKNEVNDILTNIKNRSNELKNEAQPQQQPPQSFQNMIQSEENKQLFDEIPKDEKMMQDFLRSPAPMPIQPEPEQEIQMPKIIKEPVQEVAEPEPVDMSKMSVKERADYIAKQAHEKYNTVETHPEEKKVEDPYKDDPAGSLFKGAQDLMKENNKIVQRMNTVHQAQQQTSQSQDADDNYQPDSVDDIIDNITNDNAKNELGVDDENDLQSIIAKYEENKRYSSFIDEEEPVGPADYTVIEDDEYIDTMIGIAKENNIAVVKSVSSNKRKAILNKFATSGSRVVVPLVNSGIFVEMSGSGISEIISMGNVANKYGSDYARAEVEKLNYISNHIVGSSIGGKIRLGELIKCVSYYDKDTLYYASFAATHAKETEFSIRCSNCGETYFINTFASNLLLNGKDYDDGEDAENNENYMKLSDKIKHYVTTFERLLEVSTVGKIHEKVHSNGMIVKYVHPSIEKYISTIQNVDDETVSSNAQELELAISIYSISLLDPSSKLMVEFKDVNDIIQILTSIKDMDLKTEIIDMVETVKPVAIPEYGFKASVCPHCKSKNNVQRLTMEQLLFIQAQSEREMAQLKWAAKQEAMKKSKKASKKATETL